jgi:glucose/arabinose dehydrogenase
VLSVAKNLERIADHAGNIAEDVIFLCTGEIVRHGGGTSDRADASPRHHPVTPAVPATPPCGRLAMPLCRLRILPLLTLLAVLSCSTRKPPGVEPDPVTLTTIRVASGLDHPVQVAAPPEDFERIMIVEQSSGLIRILALASGALLDTPFLDLSEEIATAGNEQGLLGIAFHPDYSENGHFFVNFTDTGGDTVIARYTVSADPNAADPASRLVIREISQPEANHNGGCLRFGPDGMLYIGMGDGGGAFDLHGEFGNAQDPGSLLGKLHRLDVDAPPPYIPADNPFVSNNAHHPETWATGLRNPWRFSFDRETGDLYMGDVGQNQREEINVQPAGSDGGEDYGWRCLEGNTLHRIQRMRLRRRDARRADLRVRPRHRLLGHGRRRLPRRGAAGSAWHVLLRRLLHRHRPVAQVRRR